MKVNQAMDEAKHAFPKRMVYLLLLCVSLTAVAQNHPCADLAGIYETEAYDPIRIAESKGIDTNEISMIFRPVTLWPAGYEYGEKLGQILVDVTYRSMPVGQYDVNLVLKPGKPITANIHSTDAFESDSQSLRGKGLGSLVYLSIARYLFKTYGHASKIQSAQFISTDGLSVWRRLKASHLAKLIAEKRYELIQKEIMSDRFLPLDKFLPTSSK